MPALETSVIRFYETEFSEFVKTDDWLELSEEEVARIVSSDGVMAPESVIIDSILHWWSHKEDCLGPSKHRINDTVDQYHSALERLLQHVRFKLCSGSYLEQLESYPSYNVVVSSQSYIQFKADTSSANSHPLSRSALTNENTVY